MTRIEIINLLRSAIALAGDGGDEPFTNEEYDAMNNFLNQLENE
jgi:hypothetical protein